MKISVILAFYNEEKYIRQCLRSILNQQAKIAELILVDDGSIDKSSNLLKEIRSSISNITYIQQKHQGPAAARNLGAKNATGDILVFLDGDMLYEKKFIQELCKPIIRGIEIATSTRKESVINLDNAIARQWDEMTFRNHGQRITPDQSIRDGTLRAIKREEFEKVNGYDSFGSQDDSSVLGKLHKTALCVDTAICYHFNPTSLSEVFYSVRWMGRNSKNQHDIFKLIIFSPPLACVKAVFTAIRKRKMASFFFRLTFELGYFLGLVDINLRGRHYK